LLQQFSGILLLLTAQWSMGIQMAFFGLFGVFTALTCKRDFLRLEAVFSLFYFLAIQGFMALFGYGSLYTSFDTTATPTACNKYVV
jgi:peptidoglycan/LPS O-acetylase OafA/YrhL